MHLAIIMDGNGRWATRRGLPRFMGHRAGAEVVRQITTYCAAHPEIEILTLFAFSTENWKRPKEEINYLMKLLGNYLERERNTYLKNRVRLKVIGDISPFSKELQKKIRETEEVTIDGDRLTQVLALNYGGRAEIVRAVQRTLQKGEAITIETIGKNLDLPTDVDLLIRTSGEERISNFLLWQIAYGELFFTPTLFPDFTTTELEKIITQFKKRERRFGAISPIPKK